MNIFFFTQHLLSLFILLIISGALSYLSSTNSVTVYFVHELVFTGSHIWEFPVLVDNFSIVFLLTVSIITYAVFNFTVAYISSDKSLTRFYLMLSLFVISIYLLILSPNLVSVFIGWDGLGVSSYFLVIYFENPKSLNAGILTALTNRLGDVFFIITLILFTPLYSWNYFILTQENSYLFNSSPWMFWIIIVASMTNSAQVPFSAWLPAAMAAPTPVSSLVHSSTLVTAGIYVIFRFNINCSMANLASALLVIGSLTIILAGGAALNESDSKNIVALSTLSQLGLIMIMFNIINPVVVFNHLVSHAYFNALLFISVGNLIHISSGYQDLRNQYLIPQISPMTTFIILVANFSLMGLPFSSGFYSNDLLFENAIVNPINLTTAVVYSLGVALTIAYSMRFALLCFSSANFTSFTIVNENLNGIYNPYLNLFPLALMGSSISNWVLITPPVDIFVDQAFNATLIVMLTSSIKLQVINFSNNNWYSNYSEGFFSMWNLPHISTQPWAKYNLLFSNNSIYFIENGWLPHSSFNLFQISTNNYSLTSIGLNLTSALIIISIIPVWDGVFLFT